MSLPRILLLTIVSIIAIPSAIYGITPVVVVDSEKSPIEGAAVSLILNRDSTIVDISMTDAEGRALLKDNASDSLTLMVRCFGYEPYKSPSGISSDTITLTQSPAMLSEVTVTSRQQSLRRKADRFIFDPGALRNEVSTSYEVIRMTPLLETSGSSVSILGKGTSQIFINGRDPDMEPDALMEMLRAMPAAEIKRIEIITTPGSAHSASAAGGIVNIVTDNPSQGLRGSASAAGEYYNERVSPQASLWTAYAHEKLRVSLSMAYYGKAANESTDNLYQYHDLGYAVRNKTRSTGWSDYLSARLNASYDLSGRSTAGVEFSINGGRAHRSSEIKTVTSSQDAEVVSITSIENRKPWIRPNFGILAFHTLQTDSRGSNLDITVSYNAKASRLRSDYHWEPGPESQQTDVKSHGVSVKPKYLLVIDDRHRLEAGYELLATRIDNLYDAGANSNRFLYKETINSGFANWDASWTSAFRTSLGLRVEDSRVNGVQDMGSVSFRHNYTDLFPSFSFSLDLPWQGNQNISMSAARYISRPFYSSLNPFVIWTSETTCSKGNINLRPNYQWSFSMYYSFLKDFVFGAYYGTAKDSRHDYTYQEDNVTVSSKKNFGDFRIANGFLSYNRSFGGFWRMKASASFYYTAYDAWLDNTDLGRRYCSYSFNLQNNIVLTRHKDLTLFWMYAFYSPTKLITNDGKYKNVLMLSVNKKFSNGITISMEADNLLGFKNDAHYTSAAYSYSEHSAMYPARVSLKFNYVFGKQKVSRPAEKYELDFIRRFEE